MAEDEAYEMSDPVVTYFSVAGEATPGDVNSDTAITIADAILAAKVAAGIDVSGETVNRGADANNDGQIGIAEVIYILQDVSGLR